MSTSNILKETLQRSSTKKKVTIRNDLIQSDEDEADEPSMNILSQVM